MGYFILAIVVMVVIGFFVSKSKQASKITMEGGMKNKYSELIKNLLDLDPQSKITGETSDSISVIIVSQQGGGVTRFNIIQTFNKVTVQWKIDNPLFGKHNMEWDFQEYGDQTKMTDRIFNDMSKYQENISKSHNL